MLLANGHTNATKYPIGWLIDEAALVKERIAIQDANQAVWTKRAIAACLDRESAKLFQEFVEDAGNGEQG
ncbi:tail protein [Achromobacter phage phiAxp-2]|uniref:Tail protein n=1 Tax=Achromobacter phage phiAxp-2 TaxID=1664246 RepID=A0A0K2FHK6_9CAUD|nr:tail length tape measure protein [Achromobacter phage phiAxp-2]ALA45445.1 tail protein [Achromobacter phage phiAxp-2]